MSQEQIKLTGSCSAKETHVRSAMTDPVVTVAVNAMIEDALNQMIDNEVSGLPVLDQDGRLAGVITEYDVLRFFRDSKSAYHPFQPCCDFMSTDIITIGPDATLEEATTLLLETSVRRLMVVEDDHLLGILSRRDVARFIRDEREAQAKMPWTPNDS